MNQLTPSEQINLMAYLAFTLCLIALAAGYVLGYAHGENNDE